MHFVSFLQNLRLTLTSKIILTLILFFSVNTKSTAHYTHNFNFGIKLSHKNPKKNSLDIQKKPKEGECEFEFKKEGDSLSVEFQNHELKINYNLPLDTFTDLQEKILEEVTEYRKKNIECTKKEYHKLAHQLFLLTMGPVQKNLNYKIIISGNDFIKNMPWSTLVKSNQTEPEYLVYEHEIILNETRNYKKEVRVDFIKKIIIAPNFEGKLWLDYQDKNIIKSSQIQHTAILSNKEKEEIIQVLEYGKNNIIHFATHNTWNEEKLDYEIILTKDKNNLGTNEISNLKTSCNLVFINACESAKIREGKSMSTAFLSASAEATIGTLWKIEDHAASQIAQYFYEELSKGKTKSTSLRNAQLKYLKSPLLTYEQHPYFWGAYTLEGDNAPLFRAFNWKLKRIYTIALPFLTTCSMLTFYFRKKIRHKILFSHFL